MAMPHLERPLRLEIEGLSKRYCQDTRRALRYAVADAAAEFVPFSRAKPIRPGEFLALDGIDLTLRAGEALAVLGENGSGKSTLLKIVYGLLKPSAGTVRRVGTVGAILELGTGFYPALTGRENVVLGASLGGIAASELAQVIDDVVEFAELERAIDAPFQTYSTGMKARLAYALATRLKPDILLVDEALAVGDMHFQRKCIAHMRGYVESGGSLLLVSHNTYQVQAVCDRAILLEQGKPVMAGNAVETLAIMFERRLKPIAPARSPRSSDSPVSIEALEIEAPGGPRPQTGKPARFVVRYNSAAALEVWWGFTIWTGDQAICITGSHDLATRRLAEGSGELSCTIPALPLIPGRYRMVATIVDCHNFMPYAQFGRDGSPTFLDVEGDADTMMNVQVQMGQLTTIDVCWE